MQATTAVLLLLLLHAAAVSAAADAAAAFVHPGVLVSNSQLELIRHAVKQGSGPMFDAYRKALNSSYGRLDYVPKGPPASGVIVCGSYNKPNFGCSDESRDTATAYLQALLWAIDGNPTYANNAMAILNLYAQKLKGYGKYDGREFNAPLQAGWSGMMYSKAAELLAHATGGAGGQGSGWSPADRTALASMLSTVTVPLIYRGSGANGNWELSMLDALAGIAVFTDNRTMFEHALDFWRQRIPAYFWIPADGPFPDHVPRGGSNWNATVYGSGSWYGQSVFNASTAGVCQETCRDFGHMQMGMASGMYTAETAFIQGVDLWAEQQPRLTAAMEIHSGFLLAGRNATPPAYMCAANPQPGLRLAFSPTMEVGYHAYAGRLGEPLPLTARHLRTQVRTMPNPGQTLIMMYETLSHGDAIVRAAAPPPL